MMSEEKFTRFIESFHGELGEIKYEQAISELAVKGERSLVVDFNDLYAFDADFASEILILPINHLSNFDMAALSKLRIRDPQYAKQIKQVHVRFRNLPIMTNLRRIGAEHIGQLIMVQGIIVRATPVQPLLIKASFRCKSCDAVSVVEQEEQFLELPTECPSCKSRRGFKLIPTESLFVNSQRITIQERPEEIPAGQLPRQVNIELKDDIVDIARPGDRISITGTLDLIMKYGKGGILREFDFVVLASNVDVSRREMELLEITPEDEEAIIKIAEDPWVHRRLLQSIAPSIYGLDTIKEAVLYLMFGGVEKELPDIHIRGDINVLLVGDPGTGKSQLLQYTARTAPRGLFTTGRGSTAAGLTAAVVKEGGTGSFILEAGALVLGDMGVVCIDEMEKMRDEDRGAIHPAMEQQVVSIAKGGIVATLNARTSILAAANPPLGRYNEYQNIAQNLGNFTVTLLSRFDLIFLLKDLPEPERDALMAEHIIGLHMSGGASVTSPIDPQLLRKYISYSKRIKPVITNEVRKIFKDFYVKMRTASVKGEEVSAISITARQLESLVRLAEARARAHLRKEVTTEDAEAAITLMRQSLEQVGIDVTTGEIDIDILYSGKPRSLQVQLQKVLSVVAELEKHGPIRDDDLFDELERNHGISRVEATKLVGILVRDNTIFSPRPGFYRRTS